MENATKALLISGGILIGLLAISIGVYLFANYSQIGSTYDRSLQATEIQKFNANFTKFEGRDDITLHEIVSVANYAREYNDKNEGSGNHIAVNVIGITPPGLTRKDEGIYITDLTELIKNDDGSDYTMNSILYDSDGLVNGITFYKN